MARFFLSIARLLRVVLVVSVAVVPRRTMWLPRPDAHPAEFHATNLIFANHMVTAAIFLDGHMALGTFFCVGRYPIRCFRVVVTFLDPLFQPSALDRVVPQFSARKTERMRT